MSSKDSFAVSLQIPMMLQPNLEMESLSEIGFVPSPILYAFIEYCNLKLKSICTTDLLTILGIKPNFSHFKKLLDCELSRNIENLNTLFVSVLETCTLDEGIELVESFSIHRTLEFNEVIGIFKRNNKANILKVCLLYYFLLKWKNERENLVVRFIKHSKVNDLVNLFKLTDFFEIQSYLYSMKAKLSNRILSMLYQYCPDIFDYELSLISFSTFEQRILELKKHGLCQIMGTHRLGFLCNPIKCFNLREGQLGTKFRLARIYQIAFQSFFAAKADNSAFFNLHYCNLIHYILRNCKSPSEIPFDLLNELFNHHPEIIEYIHFQQYPLEMISYFVDNIPSMHLCFDFMDSLIGSCSSLPKFIFAFTLLSKLCIKYPLQKR